MYHQFLSCSLQKTMIVAKSLVQGTVTDLSYSLFIKTIRDEVCTPLRDRPTAYIMNAEAGLYFFVTELLICQGMDRLSQSGNVECNQNLVIPCYKARGLLHEHICDAPSSFVISRMVVSLRDEEVIWPF